MTATSLPPARKIAWGQLGWVAVGLLWLGISLRALLAADPESQRQIHAMPIIAGAFIVLMAGWAFVGSLRAPDGESVLTDAPAVRSTLGEVAILLAIFVCAWLAMPYLGLVLTALVTFAALAAFYRDMKPWVVLLNLGVVLVVLAYGAGQLLNIPLLRSSVFLLPF